MSVELSEDSSLFLWLPLDLHDAHFRIRNVSIAFMLHQTRDKYCRVLRIRATKRKRLMRAGKFSIG